MPAEPFYLGIVPAAPFRVRTSCILFYKQQLRGMRRISASAHPVAALLFLVVLPIAQENPVFVQKSSHSSQSSHRRVSCFSDSTWFRFGSRGALYLCAGIPSPYSNH